MTELKPCPFCGGNNIEHSGLSIGCKDCGIILKAWGWEQDIDNVWNRRVSRMTDLSVICPICRQAIGEFDPNMSQGEYMEFECAECNLVIDIEWKWYE